MRDLSKEQQFTLRCVDRWLDIRNEYIPSTPATGADVDHSSLLRRLLNGDEPLPKPPPRRFSYPDYALGMGEPVAIVEFGKLDWAGYDKNILVIDQAQWLILEERDDGSFLLEWPVSKEHFELRDKVLQRI